MNNQWNFRDEILRAAHRWPLVLLFFLAGSLIGFAASYALPHTYRAEANIHVSYNADSIFRNPDDYKNWNMEQLDVIVQSDEVLKKTLQRLAAEDDYWQDISSQELAQHVQVYWRNVGIWRLVAEERQPDRAQELAQTWKSVALEEISSALDNALIAQQIYDRFIAFTRVKVDSSLRVTELTQIKNNLIDWRTSNQKSDPNLPLDRLERWQLLAWVARIADLSDAGITLMKQMPVDESPLSAYQMWVDQALVLIESELPIVQIQLEDLTLQADAAYQEWLDQNHIARGLSMYLTVESIEESAASAKPVRRESTAALVGGCLGLLLYCFIWLALPAMKEYR